MPEAHSILQQLRTGTRHLHERLEQALDILSPEFNRPRYEDVLKRFYGFYRPIEAVIPQYSDEPGRWIDGDRRKSHLIASDLQAGGMGPLAIDTLPICPAPVDRGQVHQQLGCMYVIEGSTLGGQVVTRHLRDRLGLGDSELLFFSSYGNQVGPRWRSFCAYAESLAADDHAATAIVAGAVATFLSLESWLLESKPFG
jgi:heme oxygenase